MTPISKKFLAHSPLFCTCKVIPESNVSPCSVGRGHKMQRQSVAHEQSDFSFELSWLNTFGEPESSRFTVLDGIVHYENSDVSGRVCLVVPESIYAVSVMRGPWRMFRRTRCRETVI